MVLKKVRETQSFNEFWLNVQGTFNQDHQDIDNATRRGFKLVGLRDSSGFIGRWIFKKENWYYRKGGLVIGVT